MEELSRFSDAQLRDLLVLFTDAYSSLLIDRDFTSEEYEECKAMINEIQDEIEYRRLTKGFD